MFALLTDSAFAQKAHSVINSSVDKQIFSWFLSELPLKEKAQMSVGSCNATGAPRSRTKNPPPASEAAMPVQSNSSAITKKNVSTEFKEKDI